MFDDFSAIYLHCYVFQLYNVCSCKLTVCSLQRVIYTAQKIQWIHATSPGGHVAVLAEPSVLAG